MIINDNCGFLGFSRFRLHKAVAQCKASQAAPLAYVTGAQSRADTRAMARKEKPPEAWPWRF
ncbi:hypothetical protein A9Q95_04680 [Rhodobacterales bacterium 59_46_T64]|nr:hypothetical protein A9Q95_04680 [Rhodobacterales bacterium 59_46_T64]